MKRYNALYAFTTYQRAVLAAKEKRRQLDRDGYIYSISQGGTVFEFQLSDLSVLRLEYRAIAIFEDATRQTCGTGYFSFNFEPEGLFTGDTVAYLLSRHRSERPEGQPERRGMLWQVLSRG